MRLPYAVDSVLIENLLIANEFQPLDESLSDEEAIEWVAMILQLRQQSRPLGMRERNGQRPEACCDSSGFNTGRQFQRQLQLA